VRRPAPKELTPFERDVADLVRSIPRGKTMSYGDVALWLGKPGGARAVVRALYKSEGLPWWRVIRSDSTLAPEVAAEQGRRLRSDGLTIRGRRIVRSEKDLALARPTKKPLQSR